MPAKIVTRHIREMLDHAAKLATVAEWAEKTEVDHLVIETREGYGIVEAAKVPEGRTTFTVEQTLERAANLARHAAAELDDELHKARGWH